MLSGGQDQDRTWLPSAEPAEAHGARVHSELNEGSRGARLRRGLNSAWRPPLMVAAASAAVLVCLAVRDPNESGAYPLCPFRALTGWDCPGCGSLRGLHALTQGDVARAADHNLLLVMAVPFLIWRYLAWTRRRISASGAAPPTGLEPVAVVVGIFVAVLVFWIVRNLPGVGFLGSGVG